MSKRGGYRGGSTIVGPRSGYFSFRIDRGQGLPRGGGARGRVGALAKQADRDKHGIQQTQSSYNLIKNNKKKPQYLVPADIKRQPPEKALSKRGYKAWLKLHKEDE